MRVGVVQMQSLLDYKHNLEIIKNFLIQAKSQNLEAVFLPECFYSISDHSKPTPYLVDPSGNEHYKNIQNLARKFKIFILGGSAATIINDGTQKIVNRIYNFDPDGKELESYDKIHLFACSINGKEKTTVNEGDIYSSGNTLKLLKIKDWKIGQSLCFDVRFPEMYRKYSGNGANVLTISSAFTVPTGRAHWEILLRARAIENQSYVIAAGQWGNHNENVKTWGHSMIIDPWGEVLANAKEGEKLISATLNINRVKEVRSRMNVLKNKSSNL